MSKIDRLMALGGTAISQSVGEGRQPGSTPPGMDLSAAVGRPARLEGIRRDASAVKIPLDRIVRDPEQPREEFDPDALDRLAESLKARGQLQPIRVRWDEGRGAYVVLVGERRWRAARMAGLAELSCVVVEGEIPAEERLMIQLVENALREDLRPIEQAKAYRNLMEARGWSGNQLAKELHIGQPTLVKALALLDLPEPVQAMVDRGELPPSTAYEVSKAGDEATQVELAREAAGGKLRQSEVAGLVQALKARRPSPTPRPQPETIATEFGTVTIRWKKAGPSAEAMLKSALKNLRARDAAEEAA